MAMLLHIPGIVRIAIVSDPAEIVSAAGDTTLDRDFTRDDLPLVNRMIADRVHRNLRIGDVPLPSAARRENPERRKRQRNLARSLDMRKRPWDDDAVEALAHHVRGRSRRLPGVLAQQAIGRLFLPDYRATLDTWRAAEVLDASLRSLNPFRRMVWAATGAVGEAQRRLAQSVEDDPAAVHATGIAVHSFAHSVERLREALHDRRLKDTLSTQAVLARAIIGPQTVLRIATDATRIGHSEIRPGTLIVLMLRSAGEHVADRRLAFLSDSWSFCPARNALPVMLAEIWARATGERIEMKDMP
jgi:hypothetical protein